MTGFGYSVAISGNQIVVGAHLDNDNGIYSGSAYVFKKPTSGWTNMTQTAKLLPSDGGAEDRFGCAVAISGNQIVVGAHLDNDKGTYSGSAYVFEKTHLRMGRYDPNHETNSSRWSS